MKYQILNRYNQVEIATTFSEIIHSYLVKNHYNPIHKDLFSKVFISVSAVLAFILCLKFKS
jgi:hypothetical protein